MNSTQLSLYEPLRAKYCYLAIRKPEEEDGLTEEEVAIAKECSIHPLITTHPVTGQKHIFANPSHTYEIIDIDGGKPASDVILKDLFSYTRSNEVIYEHVWQDGDLVLWDNRAVQHRASGCPESKPRKLIRTTVLSDLEPFQ